VETEQIANLAILVPFLFGCLGLFIFSWQDLKKREIENEPVFAFICTGLLLSYITGQFLPCLAVMALYAILGFILWTNKAIGGADMKILLGIAPLLGYTGLMLALVHAIGYMMCLCILTLIYASLSHKRKKFVPYVPVLTLAFIIFWAIILLS
jgi:Flp pilus assembly protein protease CpaA